MQKFTQQIILTAAGAIATGAVIYWFINRGSEVVKDVANELNPASPDNFVYDNIVNGLGRAISGNPAYDFGAHLYDIGADSSWSLWGPDNGKLNPVSPNNIPYKATNYVGSAITGKDNFDLGIWIYDLFHSDEATGSATKQSPTKPTMTNETPPIKRPPESSFNVINPVSNQNFVYKGVNSLGSAITGDEDYDFGKWIYNLTN